MADRPANPPYRGTPPCDHGLVFDPEDAKNLKTPEVREKYPRLFGECPKGCGFSGVAYVSRAHYLYGDW